MFGKLFSSFAVLFFLSSLLSSCDQLEDLLPFSKNRIENPQEFLKDNFITIPEKAITIPDFQFKDVSGNSNNFADFNGKIIFLNFWATWCAPCRYEMPDMEKLGTNMQGKNFQILAINVAESAETVDNFLKDNQYSFLVGLDENKSIAQSLGVKGLPTTFIVDMNGKVLGTAMGPRKWASKKFPLYFKTILEKKL